VKFPNTNTTTNSSTCSSASSSLSSSSHATNHVDPDEGPHQHEAVPGRSREIWTVIPTRMEYLFVLMTSFGALLFFMQMLKVLDCGMMLETSIEKYRSFRKWLDFVMSDDASNGKNINSPGMRTTRSGSGTGGIEMKRLGTRPSPTAPVPSGLAGNGTGVGAGNGAVAVQMRAYETNLLDEGSDDESGMDSDDSESGNADD